MGLVLTGKLLHANEFRVISDGVWSVVQHEVTSTLLLQLESQPKTIIVPEYAARTKWPCTNGHTCVPKPCKTFSANSSKHEGQTVLQIAVCYFTQSTVGGFLQCFTFQDIVHCLMKVSLTAYEANFTHNLCPLQTSSRQSGSCRSFTVHCTVYASTQVFLYP